jgi:signal transduction histidine kinase
MDSTQPSHDQNTSLKERTFLANAAHELRTPLHSASGFLAMALEGMAGPLSDRQQEILGFAHLAMNQLALLLEDVLFVARADSGELASHPTMVAPSTFIARAIEAVRDPARENNITLTPRIGDLPATIRVDGGRVREGLIGLLRSALTLAPSGGDVSVIAEAEDNLLRCTITLADVKLSDSDLRHLFDRFAQPRPLGADRSAHLGLGLVIAQITAAWHGGCARADTAVDGSLVLSYELPLSAL